MVQDLEEQVVRYEEEISSLKSDLKDKQDAMSSEGSEDEDDMFE